MVLGDLAYNNQSFRSNYHFETENLFIEQPFKEHGQVFPTKYRLSEGWEVLPTLGYSHKYFVQASLVVHT